jgi:hypothetical protein
MLGLFHEELVFQLVVLGGSEAKTSGEKLLLGGGEVGLETRDLEKVELDVS